MVVIQMLMVLVALVGFFAGLSVSED